MYDQVELELLNVGCTEEEIQEVKQKMAEDKSLFASLVQAYVQVQQKGIPERDMQLAWKVAGAIRKAEAQAK